MEEKKLSAIIFFVMNYQTKRKKLLNEQNNAHLLFCKLFEEVKSTSCDDFDDTEKVVKLLGEAFLHKQEILQCENNLLKSQVDLMKIFIASILAILAISIVFFSIFILFYN